MFEETVKTQKAEEKDPIEALSEILEKFESRPLLKKIERNTAVLPTLLRALTVAKGTKAAHMYVRDFAKIEKPLRQSTERLKATAGPVAVRPSAVAARIAQAATARAVTRNASPVLPAPVVPTPVVTPIPATPRSARAAISRATTAINQPERAKNGRFKSAGELEREKQQSQEPVKGMKGWFKAAIGAVIGKGKDKGGDIGDAAGKAVGGPIWEAAKEMQGAVGELKEKLQDDKTLLGKAFKFLGRKTRLATGRNAAPTEGTEQRRHRELIQAIEGGGHGGGGGSAGAGIAEAIGGGITGATGVKFLSKIPGASIAAKVLAKAGPVLGVLASGTVLAGAAAVLAGGSALKSLFMGGSNPINDLYKKTGLPKVSESPEQQEMNRRGVAFTKKMNEERVKQGKQPLEYNPVTGDVIPQAASEQIEKSSKKNGLNSNLIKGVISTESQGNPNAKSKAGAVGLMQLMPRTARDLGVADRRDPKANIKGGTAHLGRLMKKYGGNETHALQAYNWGEGNMDAYLKTGRGAKGQAMPLETINYPVKVQRNKSAYERGAIVPAKTQIKEVSQPTSLKDVVPAPLTATLMGTEKLISALNKQGAPKKETAGLAPIKTHFDDTILNLMTHDRI